MRKTIAPILLAGLSLVGVGCQSYSKDDPHADHSVPIIEKSYELVGSGKPPISLVVNSGGWIKVLDVTAGEIVHTAQLPPEPGGLIIKLDDQTKGINYMTTKGERALQILPLNPEHRYELYYQR
ncbi:MAG: hypothetical protein QM754_11120 [Tepidisphaeraceae bacterium]